MDPILFRGIERLLIVIAAIVSISFGYLLFSKSLSQTGELNATTGKMSLTLRKVGPGVFFALFGMVILVYSIENPFERSSSAPNPKQQSTTSAQQSISLKYVSGGLPPKIWAERAAEGMLGVNKALKYLFSPPKDESEDKDKQIAINQLTALRRTLIDQTFGEGAYDNYVSMQAEIDGNPRAQAAISEKERKQLDDIKSWLEAV